jgi:hypothetical protein
MTAPMARHLVWGLTAWLGRVFHAVWASASTALHAVSRHTGVPVFVLAAAAIVLSYRMARQAVRLAVEMTVVAALLLAATRLGWIRW